MPTTTTCATCGDPCPNEQCVKCWEREVLGVVDEMVAEQDEAKRGVAA